MPELRFLADMNISPMTVGELRSRGWQIVITQDLDFSALLAVAGLAGPSTITLRLRDTTPVAVTRRLADVVAAMGEGLAEGIAVSANDTTARYRKLPIGREDE